MIPRARRAVAVGLAMALSALPASTLAADPDPDPDTDTEPDTDADPEPAAPVVPAAYPRATFNLFGDVQFTGPIRQEGAAPKVVLGHVDFFARADLSAHVNALAEVGVLMHEGVFVSRLFVAWERYAAFHATVGAFHSPIGYYTPAYPHGGTVFRLATRRPRLLSMEYESEILPNHVIGLQASGRLPIAAIGAVAYEVAVGEDGNHQGSLLSGHGEKAAAVSVSWLGARGADGLEIGLSAVMNPLHLEHLGSEEEPPADDEVTIVWESLGSAHVVFERYPVEAVAELFVIGHGPAVVDASAELLVGGFVQAGYTRGRYTPYARYERFERAAADEAWNAMGAPVEYHSVLGGVRVTLLPMVAVKAQVEHAFHDDTTVVDVQVAFGI